MNDFLPKTQNITEAEFHADTSIFERLLAGSEKQVEQEKYVWNINELLSRTTPRNQHLWGCFLPKKGLAALVGVPDSGKSMFCKELALCIALGNKEFGGFPIDANHGKVIYVSTEDGEDASQSSFLRQTEKHSVENMENPENLRVIFTDQIDLDTLLTTLTSLLLEQPVDLIILDSYGDLFDGKDMNSNTEVRRFLKVFNALASEFGCLILFIHHINKSGYNDSPNQRHVQGAGALVQKLRTVLDLRLHESNEKCRYLTILKGNGISRGWKKRAIEFEFDEDTLTFNKTGNERALTDFVPRKAEKQGKDYSILFEPEEEKQTFTILVQRYMKAFGQSEITGKRSIPKIFDKGEDGQYFNPRYQSIMVSKPLGNDTVIPDTNEESETKSKGMQSEIEFNNSSSLQ